MTTRTGRASLPAASTILLVIVALLLAANLLTTSNEAVAQPPPARTAIGIAVIPHPEGQAPIIYRLWSDGAVEYSTGIEPRRQPWKSITE